MINSDTSAAKLMTPLNTDTKLVRFIIITEEQAEHFVCFMSVQSELLINHDYPKKPHRQRTKPSIPISYNHK